MTTDALLVALISFLIGLSKGGLGGPVLGAMIAPLLSQVMTVQQAVGITLPMLLTGDAMALRAYWRAWEWRYLRLLLPAALISTFIGVALLRDLPNDALKRLLGLFCLLTALYKLSSDALKQLTYAPRQWHAWLAGFIAGLGSAVANVGAPAFTAYMLLQKVSPRTFMGTVTVFFGVLNVLKVPLFLSIGALEPRVFLSLAWTLLLVPLGVAVGYWLVKRLSARIFELSMLALLIYISVALLFG
jgi:uncharacterized membrane protein YfcA